MSAGKGSPIKAKVSDGTNSASYTYLANSLLVSNIVFQQSGATRMTTTKTYDYLNRLTQISSAPSSAGILPATFSYAYNQANQRTHDTLACGSYWVYGYDSLGQVTNGCKFFHDGTPVPGQQFDYAFDAIGNRTQTQSGGDTNGANLRVANYYANSLNQITNRDIPPYVDILGASILTNTVTVNGQTAYRNQEYFRAQIPANNSTTALWTNIIVSGGQSVTGNVYVAQQPEVFKYDADGNLTNDGRWAYTWDAENRLIGMMVNTNVGPQYQLIFGYDAKGRRIQKISTTNGLAFTTNNFLYDNWNLIATLTPTANLQSIFMWGNDLSGSVQGAGGVGGLLAMSYHGTSTTNTFAAYDGNGNVSALVNATDGTISASYEYGPFGDALRSTGPIAKTNPFRFSTKYQDDESDLLYYGHRHYKASTGTWPSRDPINELGFQTLNCSLRTFGREREKSLYCFIANDSIDLIDLLGLDDLGAIHDPPNNHSGTDMEKSCAKCKPGLTCIDKEDLKRRISQAEKDLEKIGKKTFKNWNDFQKDLAAYGDGTVGQTTGLFDGGLTPAGENALSDGQKCIVKYFESTVFTGKSGNHDHSPYQTAMGDFSDWLTETWIPAEESRLQNAVAELADAESLEGCPPFVPKESNQ